MMPAATGNSGEPVVSLTQTALTKLIEDERRPLADDLAVVSAELELVRAERDDLFRRAQAAQAIWGSVFPGRQPSPTSAD